MIGAIRISVLYVLVVALASGSCDHLVEQLRADWYLLALVVAGFGTQVTLLAELRRRHRLQATAAAASGAGVGRPPQG